MSASDTLHSIGRTAVGVGFLLVLAPLAFAAGFLSAAARAASDAYAPDPLRRAASDLARHLHRRRTEREAIAQAKGRAEARAAKVAKQAAREERKRLRRAVAPASFEPWNSRENAKTAARQVRAARADLRRIRELYDAERTCAWLADIEADPYRRREAVQRIGEERLKSFGVEYAEKLAAALAAAPAGIHTPEAAIAKIGLARGEARDAELRYAIACAAAGAVPS